MRRSDFAQLSRATAKGWPIEPEHKAKAIIAALKILDTGNHRAQLAAARFLLSASSVTCLPGQLQQPPEDNQRTYEDVLRSLSREDRLKVFEADKIMQKASQDAEREDENGTNQRATN